VVEGKGFGGVTQAPGALVGKVFKLFLEKVRGDALKHPAAVVIVISKGVCCDPHYWFFAC
jgi:hypothetical protein